MKEQGKERNPYPVYVKSLSRLGSHSSYMPQIPLPDPPCSSPLNTSSTSGTRRVPSKVFWIFYLFDKCDCVSAVCIDKVPIPSSWEVNYEDDPRIWNIEQCCKSVYISILQRQRWLRKFTSENLQSAKPGMCQLFNFHCYLQKWSFELRKKKCTICLPL